MLGLGSLAGAYFTRYGAGTDPAQVMTAELDRIAVGPTSATEFAGHAVTHIVTTFDGFNGSTDESPSVILTTTIGACSPRPVQARRSPCSLRMSK